MDSPITYYSETRSDMAKFLPDQYYKVLEIGCAEGNFYENMTRKHEYWGIEMSEKSAKIASTKLYKVLTGTYEKVIDLLPDDYFDLIICNDVIEHMADHDSFFRSIKKKMKNDSFIVGSIPNVRFLLNLIELLVKKNWLYKEYGVLDRTHLRFFTEKSLKRTLIEHGFTIEEFSGINKIPTETITLKNVIKKLLIYILGEDTQFLGFGFRVKFVRNTLIVNN